VIDFAIRWGVVFGAAVTAAGWLFIMDRK